MAGPMDSVGRAAKANILLIVECATLQGQRRGQGGRLEQAAGGRQVQVQTVQPKGHHRAHPVHRSGPPAEGLHLDIAKIQNLDGELQIARSTCCKSLFSSDGARQAHMFKAGVAMLNFYRSCVVAVGATLLSGCVTVTEGQYNTKSAALRGSVAYKQKELVKCMAMMRAEPDVYRKNWATLLNTSVRAMPELYCNRFVKALASGRLTYAMYKDAHTPTADRTEFIKIIQGH
ncbi:hypothetical protein NKI74_29585 [Mesorhizobium sp. M0494]|uniref:hypothetical protein n=1 Tax=Mesorhizobium sp. M0494 TaxID=2956951 RepID=UPI00333998B0